MTAPGEIAVEVFSDRGSTPLVSTNFITKTASKWRFLLFQCAIMNFMRCYVFVVDFTVDKICYDALRTFNSG